MSHTYTCTYKCYATNLAPAALGTLLAAVPRDVATEALLELFVESDETSESGNVVTRVIVYNDAAFTSSAPMPPGNPVAAILQGSNTASFAKGTGTAMYTQPVAVA